MFDSRVALIHATPLAMQPVGEAFARLWPQAQCMNLLDDTLSLDLSQAGSLTDALTQRMVGLTRYAQTHQARGVLFTCSAFGPAIDAARQAVGMPVLKPNEAMYDQALELCARRGGACRIGLLTTFVPASTSMHRELQLAISQRGLAIEIDQVCVPQALAALNAGDGAGHDRLLLESARGLRHCQVLLLGQFSMARARVPLESTLCIPTLTSPDSAVMRLKSALG
jgi:hypothetical protein